MNAPLAIHQTQIGPSVTTAACAGLFHPLLGLQALALVKGHRLLELWNPKTGTLISRQPLPGRFIAAARIRRSDGSSSGDFLLLVSETCSVFLLRFVPEFLLFVGVQSWSSFCHDAVTESVCLYVLPPGDAFVICGHPSAPLSVDKFVLRFTETSVEADRTLVDLQNIGLFRGEEACEILDCTGSLCLVSVSGNAFVASILSPPSAVEVDPRCIHLVAVPDRLPFVLAFGGNVVQAVHWDEKQHVLLAGVSLMVPQPRLPVQKAVAAVLLGDGSRGVSGDQLANLAAGAAFEASHAGSFVLLLDATHKDVFRVLVEPSGHLSVAYVDTLYQTLPATPSTAAARQQKAVLPTLSSMFVLIEPNAVFARVEMADGVHEGIFSLLAAKSEAQPEFSTLFGVGVGEFTRNESPENLASIFQFPMSSNNRPFRNLCCTSRRRGDALDGRGSGDDVWFVCGGAAGGREFVSGLLPATEEWMMVKPLDLSLPVAAGPGETPVPVEPEKADGADRLLALKAQRLTSLFLLSGRYTLLLFESDSGTSYRLLKRTTTELEVSMFAGAPNWDEVPMPPENRTLPGVGSLSLMAGLALQPTADQGPVFVAVCRSGVCSFCINSSTLAFEVERLWTPPARRSILHAAVEASVGLVLLDLGDGELLGMFCDGTRMVESARLSLGFDIVCMDVARTKEAADVPTDAAHWCCRAAVVCADGNLRILSCVWRSGVLALQGRSARVSSARSVTLSQNADPTTGSSNWAISPPVGFSITDVAVFPAVEDTTISGVVLVDGHNAKVLSAVVCSPLEQDGSSSLDDWEANGDAGVSFQTPVKKRKALTTGGQAAALSLSESILDRASLLVSAWEPSPHLQPLASIPQGRRPMLLSKFSAHPLQNAAVLLHPSGAGNVLSLLRFSGSRASCCAFQMHRLNMTVTQPVAVCASPFTTAEGIPVFAVSAAPSPLPALASSSSAAAAPEALKVAVSVSSTSTSNNINNINNINTSNNSSSSSGGGAAVSLLPAGAPSLGDAVGLGLCSLARVDRLDFLFEDVSSADTPSVAEVSGLFLAFSERIQLIFENPKTAPADFEFPVVSAPPPVATKASSKKPSEAEDACRIRLADRRTGNCAIVRGDFAPTERFAAVQALQADTDLFVASTRDHASMACIVRLFQAVTLSGQLTVKQLDKVGLKVGDGEVVRHISPVDVHGEFVAAARTELIGFSVRGRSLLVSRRARDLVPSAISSISCSSDPRFFFVGTEEHGVFGVCVSSDGTGFDVTSAASIVSSSCRQVSSLFALRPEMVLAADRRGCLELLSVGPVSDSNLSSIASSSLFSSGPIALASSRRVGAKVSSCLALSADGAVVRCAFSFTLAAKAALLDALVMAVGEVVYGNGSRRCMQLVRSRYCRSLRWIDADLVRFILKFVPVEYARLVFGRVSKRLSISVDDALALAVSLVSDDS